MSEKNKDKNVEQIDHKSKTLEESLEPETKLSKTQTDRGSNAKDIDFLLDVPLKISVEVGRAKMLIKDFLKMKEGGIIELDKMADEPLDLYVNSRLIARGEAVVVNEKFGLRLIDVVSTMERLEKLR